MDHSFYMWRCLELAKLGAGHVAPNPMVGAVLVHNDRIIGEGWHQQYGGPHAEVNCIASVKDVDRHLMQSSTLYVSLEPCAHFGKTPPCADLIIQHTIPQVVVGCRDPFPEVNGKGIEKLRAAGITVINDVLEKECLELNKRFFTFHTKHRPYIILKWAQSSDGKINSGSDERFLISSAIANREVHKWRTEEAAIMVGTQTALMDDPSLTARFWEGKTPTRIVIDLQLRLPRSLQLFDGSTPTIVFNRIKDEAQHNLRLVKINTDENIVSALVNAIHSANLQSVLIEGGAKLLQSFLDNNTWDEIRVIENKTLTAPNGLAAPIFADAILAKTETLGDDTIRYYLPAKSRS